MKKYLFFLLFLPFVFSCENQGKRFNHEGGEVNFPINTPLSTKIPCFAFDLNTQMVLSQVYEGLVEIDPTTYQIKPLLAEKIDYSPDFTSFTFTLRKNIRYHSEKGDKQMSHLRLKPEDVIKTLEYDCQQIQGKSSYAYQNVLHEIQGAEAFNQKKADTIAGLSIEDNEITIDLERPDPSFLQKIASLSVSILPTEWLENPVGMPPGTGPFYLKEVSNRQIVLEKNQHYHKKSNQGYKLPYLHKINFWIYKNEKQKVKDFLAGKLDIISQLSIDQMSQIFKEKKANFNSIPPKLIYKNVPLLKTTLLLFNVEKPIFQAAKNRRYFNYAIDRTVFNREILKDPDNDSKVYGLIPRLGNLFNTYEYQSLIHESLNYKPSKIDTSLFENYRNDTLVLNVLNDPRRIKTGKIIQQQLKNHLGISLKVIPLSAKDFFKSIEKRDADLYLVSLSGDFLSPLSLMSHFYSGSIPDSTNVPSNVNFMRYKNWYFDQFYEKASRQIKTSDQMHNLLLAEKELLKNPPFIVLYYNYDNYIYNAKVKNFSTNRLNLISFREIYR